MGGKQAQETILGKVKETIADFLEEKGQDIELYQNELIHHLMQSGYWPAPGGAWNSYHMPIYTGKDCKGIPQFDHLDRDGNNVNEWAILDCQSPYYFYHFDTKTYNQPVIDHWIKLLLKLQKDFHFDGYRLDHVDHIVDYYSVSDDLPISYRAPASVLKRMNQELKAAVPTFATLAEYMLWDSFQGAYHQEMGFDVLWGDDMIAQWRKDIAAIDKDNHELASYNRKLQQNPLSILKTYNNQDGAIDAFDQYPGQLSEQGALFKWLKLHFLNAGPMSGRSIIYVDGDESFTQKTVQYGINHEEALCRNRDDGFTKSFNAITRLSLKHAELVNQPSKILTCGNTDGFAAWYTYQESSSEGLLIVANEKPPTECVIVDRQNHIHLTYSSCYDKRLLLDQGFEILGEYLLEESGYVLQTNAFRHAEELWFEELKPSEFHIYGIRRKR
ncbi:MAG: hypothetical protein N2376_02155 [Clostridia bacterium]|nr:hypothetical protein [Clostridia bacterium]